MDVSGTGMRVANILFGNNADFWKKKIEDNISRDKNVIEMLKRQNWSVIVVWECELKKQTLSRTLQKVNELILGNRP